MRTTLFLADDDEEDIELFTDILSDISPDINISVASNGIMLMSLLDQATELPDYIFLDLNMPLKTGFECLEEIKSSEKWKQIKTVVLSTSSHPDQIEEMYKMGAYLYLKKPNSYREFKDTLSRCLKM